MGGSRREESIETYGEDRDIGPLLEVSQARGSGVQVAMEVGYWGITVRLDWPDVARLHAQLGKLLEQ